jgi:asparaginyl-tRNA synthetase
MNSFINKNKNIKTINNMEILKEYSISEIQSNLSELLNKEILVYGWIRSVRESKNKIFLVINDGSSINDLQMIFSKEITKINDFKKINFGSFIKVKGNLILTKQREQDFELLGEEIIFSSEVKKNYPLQKKDLGLTYLRENSFLRSKTKYFLAIFRIRSELHRIINKFFFEENFLYVNTPIITINDTEIGGESFSIDSKQGNFFNKPASLTVSGQLHQESMVQGISRVYNFSPCFRAENSKTTRHLSEFWMIEAEMISYDLKELIEIIEKLIKFILNNIKINCEKEIKYLEEYLSISTLKNLSKLSEKKIPIITYNECLKLLGTKKIENENFFNFNNIEWGMDFKSEHEKYICDYFKSPVFVINYPKETKPFYMKMNNDNSTVSAVDLIFPNFGEIIGGSVREENILNMKKRLASVKLESELDWYFKLREYGYSRSAGFGMGFERLMMLVTGSENIRDVIHFYRSSKELDY